MKSYSFYLHGNYHDIPHTHTHTHTHTTEQITHFVIHTKEGAKNEVQNTLFPVAGVHLHIGLLLVSIDLPVFAQLRALSVHREGSGGGERERVQLRLDVLRLRNCVSHCLIEWTSIDGVGGQLKRSTGEFHVFKCYWKI